MQNPDRYDSSNTDSFNHPELSQHTPVSSGDMLEDALYNAFSRITISLLGVNMQECENAAGTCSECENAGGIVDVRASILGNAGPCLMLESFIV